MTIERPMFPSRAESADSFSPQPAIVGQPESKNLTSESRKPAKGLSRRVALAGFAVLPAAFSPVGGVAAAAVDPVFNLIDAHSRARAAHLAAIDELSRLEKIDGFRDWGITEQPCHEENDAFEILLGATATTLSGLLTKLAYLRAIAEGGEAWMLNEREGVALRLIDSFAASLRNVGVLSLR